MPPRRTDTYCLGEGKHRSQFARNIPFEPALWRAIQHVADEDGRSASNWVRWVVAQAMKAKGYDVAALQDCRPQSPIQVMYEDDPKEDLG